MTVEDAEYQKEYDKAAADLEAAAQATTARGSDGKFTKAEPEKVEPVEETKPEPVKEEIKPDPLADLTARLEKAEKIAKDNQAAYTRVAQEAAALRRASEAEKREKAKPAILDANPELAEAIRYVAHDPAPAQKVQDENQAFHNIVEKAHPGIFSKDLDPELLDALEKRLTALGDERSDPLVVIREITEEKIAFGERQIGKRFAAEAAKQSQKSAMAVPGAGAGGGVKNAPDAALAEVQRIQNMSDADFAKEVRKVKGF